MESAFCDARADAKVTLRTGNTEKRKELQEKSYREIKSKTN